MGFFVWFSPFIKKGVRLQCVRTPFYVVLGNLYTIAIEYSKDIDISVAKRLLQCWWRGIYAVLYVLRRLVGGGLAPCPLSVL